MRTQGFCLLLLVFFMACHRGKDDLRQHDSGICTCDSELVDYTTNAAHPTMRGALLATRFGSLEELKSVIRIEYVVPDSAAPERSFVRVCHCSNGRQVVSVLTQGISQGDFFKAGYGSAIGDRLNLLFRAPDAVANRKDLEKIYNLSRWRPEWFGAGDLAFFDFAKLSARHINTPEIAFRNARDSTEKGYHNSFNHIAAQAFITAIFSEELADLIADAHERHNHPELITGKFTEAQLTNLDDGPVDNYVDVINNEWGQELGKQLKAKYGITRETNWTPQLLADFLNDLQRYYSWAFQIGFAPYRPGDAAVQRFSAKLNAVMSDRYGE